MNIYDIYAYIYIYIYIYIFIYVTAQKAIKQVTQTAESNLQAAVNTATAAATKTKKRAA